MVCISCLHLQRMLCLPSCIRCADLKEIYDAFHTEMVSDNCAIHCAWACAICCAACCDIAMNVCRRVRRMRRADKWWSSVYLRQMLMKNRSVMSDRPTIETEKSNDRDHRQRTQTASHSAITS